MQKDFKKDSLDLTQLLNERDFIGVVSSGPKDEYDCMVNPILENLQNNKNTDELDAFLNDSISEHFGLDLEKKDINDFSNKVLNWWTSRN